MKDPSHLTLVCCLFMALQCPPINFVTTSCLLCPYPIVFLPSSCLGLFSEYPGYFCICTVFALYRPPLEILFSKPVG